jgi:hypothetical protein
LKIFQAQAICIPVELKVVWCAIENVKWKCERWKRRRRKRRIKLSSNGN